MENLPNDIFLIILFGLPGLLTLYIINKTTDLPENNNLQWKIVVIYSFVSIYTLYLITILANKFLGDGWPILDLSLNSLKLTYKNFPVFILVLLLAIIWSIIFVININYNIGQNFFGWIRKKFNLNVTSNKSLWMRQIGSRESFFAIITYSDGRKEYGVVKHHSTKENKRELFIISNEVVKKNLSSIKEDLKNSTSEGKFIDIKNGFSVEIYDLNKLSRILNKND